MLNEMDKEYRKIFFNQKRWAKHWTTKSATRHSNTFGMKKPAIQTLEYIENLQKMKISEEERLSLLLDYYSKYDETDTF